METGAITTTQEIEYQINLPDGPLRVAVAYLLPPNFSKVAGWSTSLADDCRKIELLQVNIAEDLYTPLLLKFVPEMWITIAKP